MKIRADWVLVLQDETVAAYCRYHRIDATKPRAVARHIRQTLLDDGYNGFAEQVHEGRQQIEADGYGT